MNASYSEFCPFPHQHPSHFHFWNPHFFNCSRIRLLTILLIYIFFLPLSQSLSSNIPFFCISFSLVLNFMSFSLLEEYPRIERSLDEGIIMPVSIGSPFLFSNVSEELTDDPYSQPPSFTSQMLLCTALVPLLPPLYHCLDKQLLLNLLVNLSRFFA